MRVARFVALALLALAASFPCIATAQAWPSRPIRLIVPFPPGGTGDLLGRFAAKEMQASLGQPVVVENRPGAGGVIGSDATAKAVPDGYTLVLSNIASHAIGPAVYPKMPYDAVKDFTHIGLLAAVPDVGRNPLLRLLAITTDTRATRWPDVPSVRELGLPALVASNWFGISGPAGMPAAVADRLNAALVGALNTPELAERLRSYGAEPNRMTRAEYTAMVASDVVRWAEVVKAAHIHAD